MDTGSQVFSEEELLNTQAEIDSQSSGSFIDDVKAAVSTTKNIFSTLQTMKKEFTSFRNAFEKHMEKCELRVSENDDEASQSLLMSDSQPALASPRPTSVIISTVPFENSDHNLWLDTSVRDTLYRASVIREAVRILLVAIHGIPYLRKATRTGLKRTVRNSDCEAVGASSVVEETVIPPVTLLHIHAVVKKLFPFKEAITKDSELFLKERKRRESDINKNITSVLQYYKKDYNDTGSRVVKKKIKLNES